MTARAKKENGKEREKREGGLGFYRTIRLSTNTCVSVHYAEELILSTQRKSALQRRGREKAEGANRDKMGFFSGILFEFALY